MEIPLIIAGALPFISATYLSDAQFIPVIYDSPACNSDRYGSVLECPRTAKLCAHSNDSENLPLFNGNSAGSGGDDLSAPSEELVGLLGRLTDEGRRAEVGYVGVKCESECIYFSPFFTGINVCVCSFLYIHVNCSISSLWL